MEGCVTQLLVCNQKVTDSMTSSVSISFYLAIWTISWWTPAFVKVNFCNKSCHHPPLIASHGFSSVYRWVCQKKGRTGLNIYLHKSGWSNKKLQAEYSTYNLSKHWCQRSRVQILHEAPIHVTSYYLRFKWSRFPEMANAQNDIYKLTISSGLFI